MSNGIIIIKITPNKKPRRIPEPKAPWWKGLNDTQRKAYIAALDGLDKAATRKSIKPQRSSEV